LTKAGKFKIGGAFPLFWGAKQKINRVWYNHDCGFHSQSQSWLCFHNHDCANFGRPKWPQSQSQSFPTITISNHFLQSDCWLWLWNDWLWGHNLIAIISPGHVASCNLTWFNNCFAWFWIRYSLAFGCIWILYEFVPPLRRCATISISGSFFEMFSGSFFEM
jgi:hypothetical protein